MIGADEIWRDVVGHAGFYQVSSLGRVRSVARMVRVSAGRGCAYDRPVRERILRSTVSHGYPSVTLWRGHVPRVERVHCLVLEAFVGPRPDGFYGCHRDDVRTNNSLENLYWGSPTENCADKIALGNQPRGSRIPWSKLSEQDVASIRALRGKASQEAIGKLFGVPQSRVSRIVNGECWRHVAFQSNQ
ncbi:NUMOD4 domain-containing protein [Azospirillum himalayense]|uniref:NUMOD4 domain-containing protein n=1 Tax=Azospirillum himalayense TaxID=654847 RepID=A0ABW0FY34_9PROT